MIIPVLNLTKCCYIVFTRKPLLTMSMYHIYVLVTFTPLATLSPYINTLIYFNIQSLLVPSDHKWKPERKKTNRNKLSINTTNQCEWRWAEWWKISSKCCLLVALSCAPSISVKRGIRLHIFRITGISNCICEEWRLDWLTIHCLVGSTVSLKCVWV